MPARIKHIALHTDDPAKTAGWYKEVFGLSGAAPEAGRYGRRWCVAERWLHLLRHPEVRG